MIICFLHVDANGEYAQYGDTLAQLLVKSCKRVMPDIPVVHLAGPTTAAVSGADWVNRIRPQENFLMPFKLQHLAQISGDFIFLDTDILVTEPIQDVFDKPFDVAMYWRDDVEVMSNGSPAPKMPYNAGFMACRNQDFFKEAYELCLKQDVKYKIWFGDQVAIADLAKTGRYRFLDLPRDWNHAVTGPDDLAAKVLHFKGPRRKQWMPGAARKLGICAD